MKWIQGREFKEWSSKGGGVMENEVWNWDVIKGIMQSFVDCKYTSSCRVVCKQGSDLI